MGVGRFVYTPILPLMRDQAGLSSALGANLATANFIGYLLGALIGIAAPAVVRSAAALRGSLLVLVGTLALMSATHDGALWFALRLVAGAASALTFVIAFSAMLTGLRAHAHHLVGWAFGGVGAGIALSGLLVVAVQAASTWQAAWLICAALAAVLAALAWPLPHTGMRANTPKRAGRPTGRAPTAGSSPCWPATPSRGSATSSPAPSASRPSRKAFRAGSAAGRGSSSASPPCPPAPYGPGWPAAGPGPPSC